MEEAEPRSEPEQGQPAEPQPEPNNPPASDPVASRIDELSASFTKVLNQHGYGFQFAVIKAVDDLYSRDRQWLFEAAEFPVSVQGADTRIDLVLRHQQVGAVIIGECKRANPALSNWCFVRAPFLIRSGSPDANIFEWFAASHGEPPVGTGVLSHHLAERPYHLAFEIKTQHGGKDSKGDSSTGRGAIEEAAGQVFRGLNGFVETLIQYPPT